MRRSGSAILRERKMIAAISSTTALTMYLSSERSFAANGFATGSALGCKKGAVGVAAGMASKKAESGAVLPGRRGERAAAGAGLSVAISVFVRKSTTRECVRSTSLDG